MLRMDSVSQAALGAAVAVAVMQRRTAVWKAAAWGAVAGTLPDLDVWVDYGDPILNMVLHRAETHALFWLTLFSAPLAWCGSGLRANAWGLVLSTAYLGWSVLAQQQVTAIARATIQAQGIAADRVLVTPSAFNTVLWRVVVVGGGAYNEGFYSFFDDSTRIDFRNGERGEALLAEVQHVDGIQRIRRFSKGLYALRDDEGMVRISDLRMGQHPSFTFAFHAAQRQGASAATALVPSRAAGRRPDAAVGLPWLWRRMWGERISSPG